MSNVSNVTDLLDVGRGSVPRSRVGVEVARAAAQVEADEEWQDRGRAIGNARLTAVLDLLAEGYAVVQIVARAKEPLGAGVRSPITSSRMAVARWEEHPDANLAVCTGHLWGLVIVDLDGPDGERGWAEFEEQHGSISTRTTRSGRVDGGRHLYFKVPESASGLALSGGNGLLGAGIDVKADGGYVVVPPSVHSTGNLYEVIDGGPIAELPEPILTRLVERGRDVRDRRESRASRPVGKALDDLLDEFADVSTVPEGQARLAVLCAELAACPKGGGRRNGRDNLANAAYFTAAVLVASGLLNLQECLDELAKAMDTNGLGAHEAKWDGFKEGLERGKIDPLIVDGNTPETETTESQDPAIGHPNRAVSRAMSDLAHRPSGEHTAKSDICAPPPPRGGGHSPRSSRTRRGTSALGDRLSLEDRVCPQPKYVVKLKGSLVKGILVTCRANDCQPCQRRALIILADHVHNYVLEHPGGILQFAEVSEAQWPTFSRKIRRHDAEYIRVPTGTALATVLIWAPDLLSDAERIEDHERFEALLEEAWHANRRCGTAGNIHKSKAWRPPTPTRDDSWDFLGIQSAIIADEFRKVLIETGAKRIDSGSPNAFVVEVTDQQIERLPRWFRNR